jgi:phage baseplate assembly protein W
MGEGAVTGRVSRGLAWPMRVDHRGSIALDVGVADIERSIHAVLATTPGERLMRPDFGCGIWRHLGADLEPAAIVAAADSVREALSRWEPRIVVDEVTVSPISAERVDAITLVTRRGRAEQSPTGADVVVAFTERATGASRTLAFRCEVLPAGIPPIRPEGDP